MAQQGAGPGVERPVRVGLIGTSWWADSMYLPALADHPAGRCVAVCGRDRDRAEAFAHRWSIPAAYTSWQELLDCGDIDAVIVASSNDSHHAITMAAIERGLPVLCEKPIALDDVEARAMATAARDAGIISMVPFTYRWMPTNQFVRKLITDGYIGRPYHLNLRYFAGYARGSEYAWRFDEGVAGSGIIGDLGAHWVDMARWFLGEISEISANASRFVERDRRADGSDYPRAEDDAVIMARFESGAYAVLQMSAVCWEGTPFGQTHHLDLHGSDGTLYGFNDWTDVQEVRGVRADEPGPAQVLTIPDDVWAGAPHVPVHDTYKHMFRRTEAMTRGWLTAIAEGRQIEPDLATGARVQELLSAALASVADGGRWQPVPVSEAQRR